jgi:Mechanosensitive ion channel
MKFSLLYAVMLLLGEVLLLGIYLFPQDRQRSLFQLVVVNMANLVVFLTLRPLARGRVSGSAWLYAFSKSIPMQMALFVLLTTDRTYPGMGLIKGIELALLFAIVLRTVLKGVYFYTKKTIFKDLASGHNMEILKLEKYILYSMNEITLHQLNAGDLTLNSFYKRGRPKDIPVLQIFEKWSSRDVEGDNEILNEYGYDLGESIRIPNRPRLTPEHESATEGAVSVPSLLNTFLPHQANELFEIISYGERARIRYTTFSETFRQVSAERSALHRSLDDYKKLLTTFRRLLLLVEGILLFLLVTLAADMRNFLLNALLSFFLVYLIVPGSMSFSESFIFLVLAHPYDNGDRVLIRGENMVVRRMGLFSTSFDTWSGQRVIIQNSEISKLPIVNIRRSLSQYWTIKVPALLSTPPSAIDNFKRRLRWYVSEEKMLTSAIFAPEEIIDNNTLLIKVLVRKKSNFQSGFFTLTNFTKCLACVVRILIEEKIYYKPPVMRARATDSFFAGILQGKDSQRLAEQL